jgi:hypothetical protein
MTASGDALLSGRISNAWNSTVASAETDRKQQAHELIDQMAPGQVSAVVALLKIMLDPLARTLVNAPYDDEPESAEEARAIAAAGVMHRHEVYR